MSMNRYVRLHGSLAPRGMGVIYHLGVLNPPEPVIKTEEAVGLVGGAGLFGLGLMMKGKGGLVLSIVGGIAALVSGGFAAVRALSPATPTVTGPTAIIPVAPKPAAAPTIPGLPSSANAIVQALAPIAQQLVKQQAATPSTSAPAPSSAIITSIPGYSPNPAPASGFEFNSY